MGRAPVCQDPGPGGTEPRGSCTRVATSSAGSGITAHRAFRHWDSTLRKENKCGVRGAADDRKRGGRGLGVTRASFTGSAGLALAGQRSQTPRGELQGLWLRELLALVVSLLTVPEFKRVHSGDVSKVPVKYLS